MAFDLGAMMGLGGGDPALEQQLRNQALMRFGLGMMQGSGSGQPTGAIMGQAGLGALGDMQQIGQMAYMNKMRQQQSDRESKLFEQQTKLNENKLAEDERQRTITADVQALIDKGDSAGAARLALTSGNPQLANWGADVLKPGGTGTANMRDYQYLEELRKTNPAAAERFQNILQPPRSAYYQGTPMVDPNGNIWGVGYDTRTDSWHSKLISPTANGLGSSSASVATPSSGASVASGSGLGATPQQAPMGGLGSPAGLLPLSQSPALQGSVAQARAAGTTTGESQAKREFTMSGVGDIIDQADSILNGKVKPTHSRMGTAIDAAGTLIGSSPEGAAEADQLKVLGGYLVSKMPRMEGPQSDYDVQIYKQMAADVGNSTLPIDRRRAALSTLRNIVSRYDKGMPPPPSTSPASAPRRFKYNPATGNLE